MNIDRMSDVSLDSLNKINVSSSGYDSMTGLLHMSLFIEEAEKLISENSGKRYDVLYFDIEDFKTFNLNYSYAGGNRLLKDTAEYIKRYFEGALISRLADDHFAALCERSDSLIQKVTDFHERLNNYSSGSRVEIKVGICRLEKNLFMTAMDNARYACGQIKGNYSAFYYIFDDRLLQQIEDQRYILSNIDEALENDYVQVYYQPIVRASTEKLCVWEALARWIDPVKGMITPDKFINILEDYQLIHKLDSHIVRSVASHYKGSVDRWGDTANVSMNFSRLDFHLCNLFEVVDDAAREFGVPRENLKIEVTESAFMSDIDFVYNQLDKFRSAGYDLWLDDFGSGYSSINVIKDFDFDLMKLDMTFLDEIETSERARQMLISTIRMAKELNIQTVCEGVETKEQAELLRSYGCEMLQGYYYGKPLPVAECERVFFSKGNQKEERSLYKYYGTLGKVNLLNTFPLRRVHQKSLREELKSYPPRAVFEYCDGRVGIIQSSETFLNSIAKLGFYSLSDLENAMNNKKLKSMNSLESLKEKAYRSRTLEEIDFIVDGCYCMVSCEYITQAKDAQREAYLVTFNVYNDIINTGDFAPKTDGLEAIASFYKIIVFLSDSGDAIKIIHKSSNAFDDAYVKGSVLKTINNFARLNVNFDQRSEFITFMDNLTLPARLKASGSNSISGRFMMKDDKGEFSPHIINLAPATVHGQNGIIVGIFMQDSVLGEYLEQKDDKYFGVPEILKIDNEEYLTNIVNCLPGALYWKDKEMRFAGANQAFMDFFGFVSPDEFMGKTDDDIQWKPYVHVDRELERDILDKGIFVTDFSETCVFDGVPHEVLITKKPFYVNGKIEGFIGCFFDNTLRLQKSKDFVNKYIFDSQTGVVSNDSYIYALSRYEEKYKEKGIDFALIYVDFVNYIEYQEKFGEEFSSEMLMAFVGLLRKHAGDYGVIVRNGEKTFAVVLDVENISGAEIFMEGVKIDSAACTSIDGVECRYELAFGYSLYSSRGNLKRLTDSAKKQMRTQRHSMLEKGS